ncbi:MAG: signal peptide peptidase SppA [bacterium]|nr:signal peptide peptidase SppA [Gammaproteobacteria bacterium]
MGCIYGSITLYERWTIDMLGRILKGTWNAITAAKNATFNLIFLLVVFSILVGIFSSDSPSIPDSAAIVINPTGIIVEQKQAIDPVAQFMSGYDKEDAETLLKDILDAIDAAAADERIKVLVLDLSRLKGAGFSKLEEIGYALERFRQADKPVYAFARSYSQEQYYLATHASEIYIDEQSQQMFGGVFLTGFGVYPTYFKSALEKFKINFHVYKAGKYKSAVEPYERDSMSPEAKLANLNWLEVLWSKYAQTVVSNREISLDDFNRYTNNYDTLLGNARNDPNLLAVQHGLVDDILTRIEWFDMLKDIVGEDGKSYNRITFQDYLSATRPPIPILNPASDKIAVITASGTIYDGERSAGEIGGDTIARLIQKARNDVSVKALVLRVDSPGGSPSASEQIRSELALTQSQGKPVVISMGSYAASGGYWIAASANKIFAASTTITGSIGVFSMIPTFAQAAAEFGVYTDGVGTTKLSSSMNLLNEINPAFDRTVQKSVEFTYRNFVNLVADGRDMQPNQVHSLAQGRVWAATDALKNGLIDALGGLNDAIDSAALLADVGSYEILYLEQTLTAKEKLFSEILNSSLETIHYSIYGASGTESSLKNLAMLNPMSSDLGDFFKLSQKPGIYTQCLDCRLRN